VDLNQYELLVGYSFVLLGFGSFNIFFLHKITKAYLVKKGLNTHFGLLNGKWEGLKKIY